MIANSNDSNDSKIDSDDLLDPIVSGLELVILYYYCVCVCTHRCGFASQNPYFLSAPPEFAVTDTISHFEKASENSTQKNSDVHYFRFERWKATILEHNMHATDVIDTHQRINTLRFPICTI